MSRDMIAGIRQKLRELYGPNSYYVKAYSQQEESYWWYLPSWMEEILPKLGSGARILDIGAAYGTLACYASLLTGASVVTLDRVNYMHKDLRDIYFICPLSGDIEREALPKYLPSWDVVILTEVLEHFNFHPLPTLRKIVDGMSSGSRLYLSTPDSATWGKCNNYSGLHQIPMFNPDTMSYDWPKWVDGHIWQYSEAELMGLMDAAGLRIHRMASSVSPGGKHFNLECIKD